MSAAAVTAAVELVIFDLDGVLVDTQWAETESLRTLADRMGVQLSAEQAEELFAGRRLAECVDAGLLTHFTDRIYSAYEIERWKPDPGLFAWAARANGAAGRTPRPTPKEPC